MRVALAYASLFGVAATAVATRSAPVRDAWLAYLSTDLDNLADHPLRALIGSAFVTDDPNVVAWTALALVGLASASEALGDVRTVGLLASTHVLGTLVSQSVLALRLRLGDAAGSARTMLDVGPSYVVAPALVLGIVLGSTRARIASGLGFAVLAPYLFGGLPRLEVSAVGHVVAIGTALVAGPALRRRTVSAGRSRPRSRDTAYAAAMVLEVALIDVTDPDAFAAAYLEAREVLATTPGCRSVRMTRGVETVDRFVLLVEWDDVEAHERNFRGTDRFTRWRAAVGPWFAGPPRVEHFTDVG